MNIEDYERRASDFLDLMPDHENDVIPEDKSEENCIYYTYSPSVGSDDYSGYTINSPHIPVRSSRTAWRTTASTTTAWTTGWGHDTNETLPF